MVFMLQNSNVSCVNNVFMNMLTFMGGAYPGGGWTAGNGVYATETDYVANRHRLRVFTPMESVNNNQILWISGWVWNAIRSFHLIGQQNRIDKQNKSGTTTSPYGEMGYMVKTPMYDTVDISMDTISNLKTGIGFWQTADPAIRTLTSTFRGAGRVNNNIISASPLGFSAGMPQRCDKWNQCTRSCIMGCYNGSINSKW
jgi:hypothetical protein